MEKDDEPLDIPKDICGYLMVISIHVIGIFLGMDDCRRSTPHPVALAMVSVRFFFLSESLETSFFFSWQVAQPSTLCFGCWKRQVQAEVGFVRKPSTWKWPPKTHPARPLVLLPEGGTWSCDGAPKKRGILKIHKGKRMGQLGEVTYQKLIKGFAQLNVIIHYIKWHWSI